MAAPAPSEKKPLLVLIDGHALAYRFFHALDENTFSTREGETTNSVYGFARLLFDTILDEQVTHLVVVFDQGLSGREQLYADYKAQRDEMPVNLAGQLSRIEQVAEALSVAIVDLDGYEADDVIGTLAQQAKAAGCEVRIISGDRDLLQLLNDHVKVQLPVRNEPDKVWDVAAFREKYAGLQPQQLIDVKGLMGDSSDNIPGVKGIGEKGALDLISQFGSLEALYDRLDEVPSRYRSKLEAERDMAFLSKRLATIMHDLPVTLDMKDFQLYNFDLAEVEEIFDTLEFGNTIRNHLSRVARRVGTLPYRDPHTRRRRARPIFVPPYTLVTDDQTLARLVEKLNAAKLIAVDTETTSLDRMQAKLVGISLAVDSNHGYYIPVGHTAASPQPSLFGDDQAPQQLPLDKVIEALRPALTNPHISKALHNAGYDVVILRRHGIDVNPITEDTMIAEWLLDPDLRRIGLKDVAQRRLNLTMERIENLLGSGKKQITFDRVPLDKAAPYAAADAVVTYRLVPLLDNAFNRSGAPKARNVYQNLELPLIPILANMEMVGVRVDLPYLRQLAEEMTDIQKTIEAEIYKEAGQEFNINSIQQLNEVLFNVLKLSTSGLKKTKTSGFSLTADVLEELAETNNAPILRHIMQYRAYSKLLSTYVLALPKLVNPETQRVHTSFRQTGTATGRISSSDPNLQNIPIRTEDGRRVRRAIIAEEGHVLLSVDYSQIELRILAHYSGDDALRKAFQEGQDIHRATAAKVFGVPPEKVTFEQRRFAKSVNFGLMYGMGAFRLARESELTLADAERFIEAYFANFPGVRDYLDATRDFATQNGYVETLFGRRRRFPQLQREHLSQTVRQRLEREAINMPIQGTAADIIKLAMITIERRLRMKGLQAQMLLQVHDELLLEMPEDEADTVQTLVIDAMQEAGNVLDVPVVAAARYGANWIELS